MQCFCFFVDFVNSDPITRNDNITLRWHVDVIISIYWVRRWTCTKSLVNENCGDLLDWKTLMWRPGKSPFTWHTFIVYWLTRTSAMIQDKWSKKRGGKNSLMPQTACMTYNASMMVLGREMTSQSVNSRQHRVCNYHSLQAQLPSSPASVLTITVGDSFSCRDPPSPFLV